MAKQIPLVKLKLNRSARAVYKVVKSGKLAQGKLVEKFELQFAELVGVKHAVAVNNGTTALLAPLKTLNLQPSDEIITTGFTFGATLNSILESGATARLVDIDPTTYCISPKEVERAINNNTRAILPVHLYGHPSNMSEIMDIAKRYRLIVIEDAAQAHGANWQQRNVGSFGYAGAFSFYATKNITTGEGGLITTNDDKLAMNLRIMRNQGMTTRYEYVMPGNNFRMTEISAAMGLAQLKNYKSVIASRNENASYLTQLLSNNENISTPSVCVEANHAWHQYTIRVLPNKKIHRNQLKQLLAQEGISSDIYYPKILSNYDVFMNHERVKIGQLIEAKSVADSCLSLPVHQNLKKRDIRYICKVVNQLTK